MKRPGRPTRRTVVVGAAVLVGATVGTVAVGAASAPARSSMSMSAQAMATMRADSAAPPATPTSGSAIVIRNFSFSPGSVEVTPGQRVEVANRDTVAHTVTSTTGRFDTGDVAPGATVTFTAPTTPGTYPYRCNIHQYMTGTLVVS